MIEWLCFVVIVVIVVVVVCLFQLVCSALHEYEQHQQVGQLRQQGIGLLDDGEIQEWSRRTSRKGENATSKRLFNHVITRV